MRLQPSCLLACLCLCAAPVALATLFEPKGSTTSGNTLAVQVDQPFKVFDTVFPSGTSVYATRFSGRLAIGQAFTENYRIGKLVEMHVLLPLEIFTSFKAIPATLYHANITGDLLSNLSSLVRDNFWHTDDFNATGGSLFTWENQQADDKPEKNTFQLALFYDASSTYSVFNYHSVDFVKHLDESIMAGFALGKSHELSVLPFSGEQAKRLSAASGVGDRQPGRFVYRVDSWPPARGGCLSEDPAREQDRTLASSLTRDSVLGGGLAIVSGRCPDARTSGVCRVRVEGKLVSERPAVPCERCGGAFVACEVPPSLRVGLGELSLSLASQPAYSREFSFISPDDPSVVQIFFNDSMDAWMQTRPTSLSIAYETNSSLNGTLKLQVVGYSEAGLDQIGRAEDFSKLTKVLYEGPASSQGRMDLAQEKVVRCATTSGADCESYHVGFLRILDDSSPAKSLRSRIIPLGWFVQPYYQTKQRPDWAAEKCKAWHDAKSPETAKVESQLRSMSCPGRLKQAMANPGDFLPATYCPELPGGCGTASPKQSCFVSRPTSGADVHGVPASRCCYNEAEDLLYQETRDDSGSGSSSSQFGSSSLRSHPRGQPHTGQPLLPGQASYLSHWYWDTLPHLYCCRWSGGGNCHLYYMQMRPTPKPSAYAAGATSHMVGDPHLTSYSGRRFLFNGYGEYWLLRSDNIDLQARYLTLPPAKGATFMTALAIRAGSSYLEVFARGTGLGPRFLMQRRPDVASDLTLPVDIGQTAREPFQDAGIAVQLVQEDRLIVQLTSGKDTVGIELKAAAGNFSYMDPFFSLSDTLRDRTSGLLGRWTSDPAKEFVDVRGGIAEYNASSSVFHSVFCVKNQLKNVSESLFSYSGDTSRQAGFVKIKESIDGYTPVFTLPSHPHPQESSVCGSGGGDTDCVFDLRVTQNTAVAASTAATGKLFAEMRGADNSTGASVCDVPAIPGIRVAQALTVGTSLSIACAQPLRASQTVQPIVCTRRGGGDANATAVWVPDPASLGVRCGLAAPAASQASIGLIVGIVVPLLVVILVVIVVVVFLMRRRSNRKEPDAFVAGTQVPMSQQQQQQQESNEGVQRALLGGVKYPAGSVQRSSRPGGNDEPMSKGGYQHPADQDDGSRRNPRVIARQQPDGYTGVATADTDDSAAAFAASGGGPSPYAAGPPPVPAQRGMRSSYQKSQRDPVMRPDDGADLQQQPAPPPPLQQRPQPRANKPMVSRSEDV